MATKNLTVRIDEKLLHKLHIVASYEERSANSQIIFLVKKCVEDFEIAHEEIVIDSKKKSKSK